jgi:hypothetical protein
MLAMLKAGELRLACRTPFLKRGDLNLRTATEQWIRYVPVPFDLKKICNKNVSYYFYSKALEAIHLLHIRYHLSANVSKNVLCFVMLCYTQLKIMCRGGICP